MGKEDEILDFFHSVNSRDLEKMAGLLTESTAFYFPKTQPLIGRGRILKFFRILFRQYPALSFEVERVIIQGTAAAVHWTNEGVNRRQIPYENEGVTLLKMEGGKIVFMSDFFKDTEKF